MLLIDILLNSNKLFHISKSDSHIGHMLTARPFELEEAIEEGPVIARYMFGI